MMPNTNISKAGLSRAKVIEAASQIADEDGPAGLTMAALAKRLGVALPSLYSHVRGFEHLKEEIFLAVNSELSRRMGEAIQGYAGRDAMRALANAYRDYAFSHPGRYAIAMQERPNLANERHQDAALKCGQIVYGAVRGYGLLEVDLTNATRFLRATLHGFVSIEIAGGYALSDATNPAFETLLAAVDRALSTWPGSPTENI